MCDANLVDVTLVDLQGGVTTPANNLLPASSTSEESHEAMVESTTPPEVTVLEEADVACLKKDVTRRRAVLWPPLEKKEGNKLVFPFLDRKNSERDFQLCSVLAMGQIYTSSHGNKGQGWEEARLVLVGLRNGNGDLLFPDGISSTKTIQRRMLSLMQWIKKYRDTAALRSGTDDEVHSDFISLLENLLEQKETAEEEFAERQATTGKVNQRKASEAEVLRLAAMSSAAGRKRLAEVFDEAQRNKKKIVTTPTSTSPTDMATTTTPGSLSSMSHSPTEFLALTNTLSEQRSIRERKLDMRAERIRFRQEMMREKMEEKKKRREEENRNRVDGNNMQQAIIALMQQQQQSLRLQEEANRVQAESNRLQSEKMEEK